MDSQALPPRNPVHPQGSSAVDQFVKLTRSLLGFEPWIPRTYAQTAALNSTAEILLFGGAAGGLKTETLLRDAVAEASNPNMNAVVFRNSYDELADIVRKSRRLYSGFPYFGTYGATDFTWVFPRNRAAILEYLSGNSNRRRPPIPDYNRGATIRFRHLSRDEECHVHDGQEYSFIGFDESTHQTEYRFRYLLTRLRSTDPKLFCRVRLATNPGNVGHSWHMKLFIGQECSHCKPNSSDIRKPFVIHRDAKFEDGTKVNHTTQFIPARVDEHNLFAAADRPEAGNDPYIRKLALQKPALAKALKEGCWAQVKGQYFTCWDESRGQDVPVYSDGPDMRMVIPFAEAPVQWWHPHFTGTDWGVGSSQAASYLCVRTPGDKYFPNGRLYVLKEWCEADSDIDRYPAEFVRRFLTYFQSPDGSRHGTNNVACYLGPDSWANRGDGHTIAGQFQQRIEPYSLMLSKASTDREGGWQLIYGMLKSGELVICGDTCPNLLKALPTRIHDPKKPGDIVKIPGDHHDDEVDALRYAIYTYITSGDAVKPVEVKVAEAMARHRNDPTTAMIRRQQILAEAEQEEEGEVLYYAPPSPRQRLRELERQRRWRYRR